MRTAVYKDITTLNPLAQNLAALCEVVVKAYVGARRDSEAVPEGEESNETTVLFAAFATLEGILEYYTDMGGMLVVSEEVAALMEPYFEKQVAQPKSLLVGPNGNA